MPCETQEFFSIVFVFFQHDSMCYIMRNVTPCGTFFCQEKNTLRASREIPYNGAPRLIGESPMVR